MVDDIQKVDDDVDNYCCDGRPAHNGTRMFHAALLSVSKYYQVVVYEANKGLIKNLEELVVFVLIDFEPHDVNHDERYKEVVHENLEVGQSVKEDQSNRHYMDSHEVDGRLQQDDEPLVTIDV